MIDCVCYLGAWCMAHDEPEWTVGVCGHPGCVGNICYREESSIHDYLPEFDFGRDRV